MRQQRLAKQNGISLPEILVGLAIGMLTLLVVMQVMSMARANQRVTSSAADTLTNSALGLYTIERDARSAGYGLASFRASIGCEVRSRFGAANNNFTLVPVQITDGAAGAPDSIEFMASNKNGVTLPTRIAIDHALADPAFFVESDLGVQTGDMMMAVPATLNTATPATTWCSVFQVVGAGSGPNQVPKMTGANSWNPDVASSVFPAGGYAAGDYLINLGTFSRKTYSISNTRTLHLTQFVSSNNTNTASDLYSDVVQLQAVYGKDTTVPSDGVVDAWNATAPATPAEWQQVRAVRIALVARSATTEASNVTLDGAQAASTCNSATPHPAAVCWRPDPAGNGVKIDVSSGTANWQRYRYRVFESTVALRNTIWQQ